MIYPPCPVPNTFAVTAMHTFFHRTFPKNYFFGGESHDFAEAVCVLRGEVGITADKHVYTLTEGQIALHPPGEFHAIWSHGDSSPETFVFSFSASPTFSHSRTVYEMSGEEILTVRLIYEKAKEAFIIDDGLIKGIKEGKELQASLVAKSIELFLLEVTAEERSMSLTPRNRSQNYTRILSVMEKNLHAPMSLEELSRLCDMSVPSLEKTVFRYSHCGVISLFNSIKMKKAREYLRSGMSVKETAAELGFSNQNYFSTAFKKHFGHPPSVYRK